MGLREIAVRTCDKRGEDLHKPLADFDRQKAVRVSREHTATNGHNGDDYETQTTCWICLKCAGAFLPEVLR